MGIAIHWPIACFEPIESEQLPEEIATERAQRDSAHCPIGFTLSRLQHKHGIAKCAAENGQFLRLRIKWIIFIFKNANGFSTNLLQPEAGDDKALVHSLAELIKHVMLNRRKFSPAMSDL